ncbi:3-oxoacyl-[acyl-carrier-protein] reductase FabG [Nocardioides dokdonensis FR1436]|uniref:3-oxoacyl-[acyl-carrier-protein] reductase FabG n=1 Tax=Nocardioides dokdonensis FR1436 TaxID=1300347 RepID=A0A1A9GNG5_9ACTN|nr:SDR family NAD(P)-dependent oxidoreductase [Nocardioides dokdonensis]ANH39626.1 3-oxoacyl-[acyl-carrier-protein] reductase FabG [Nocardioides dokdonensis FR1436]
MRRNALVVGGGSGIGAGVAHRLARDGYDVVVADLDEAGATSVAGALPGPGTHRGAGVDVTDEASLAALLEDVAPTGSLLDACVNTAGVSTLGAVTDLPAEEWRRVIDVCLTGGFLVVQAAARKMRRGGSIVSLTSLNARQPGAGLAPYCAAKAGLAMLTEVAALELGPVGIRVNAVSPGLVVTPLTAPAMDIPGVREDYVANTPLGRPGSVEDVAAAVAFLCSDESGWMTGEVMDLNGGAHLMRYPDVMGHVVRMLEHS